MIPNIPRPSSFYLGIRDLALASALISIVAVACERQAAPPESPPASSDATVERVDTGSVFASLAPGDSVLGMRVESAEVRPEVVDSFGWMGLIRFSGPITLTGRYQPHPQYPEVQELCFFPDSASAARLPRFPNDSRVSWLCFSNQQAARARLGALPAAGDATVEVDSFAYQYQHTDVYNTARFVRTLDR